MLAARARLDGARFLDLDYRELVGDPLTTMAKIAYEIAGDESVENIGDPEEAYRTILRLNNRWFLGGE